jgi:branched-chain amino acid transport system substrate-binding protein
MSKSKSRSISKVLDGVSRRGFLRGTAAGVAGAAGVAAAGVSGSGRALAADKTVKIGFLAPLTGEVAAWGLPGLYGCEIWAEWVNGSGGIQVGGESYQVEFVSYDNEYAPDKARTGAQKLIHEDEVKFIMMLGGDT